LDPYFHRKWWFKIVPKEVVLQIGAIPKTMEILPPIWKISILRHICSKGNGSDGKNFVWNPCVGCVHTAAKKFLPIKHKQFGNPWNGTWFFNSVIHGMELGF
jgi:hypothetical protein